MQTHVPPLQASELFALAHSARCTGDDRCHWCGSPCSKLWRHDDKPLAVGVKRTVLVACPNNAFICTGCWIWRRGRTTVFFLDHNDQKMSLRDGQCLMAQSVYCDETGAWAVRPTDGPLLYERLLNPPRKFFLALTSSPQVVNHLQQAVCNDLHEITAQTELTFTLDGVPFVYSVYELEMSRETGPEGRLPGVQALHRLLGAPPKPPSTKKLVGRPVNEELKDVKARESSRRIVRVSGESSGAA